MAALPPQLNTQPPLAANLNSPLAEENVCVQTQTFPAPPTNTMLGVVFQPLCVPGTAIEE